MNRQWYVSLAATLLAMSLMLSLAGVAAAQGVGEDGYLVVDMAVAPTGGACIGDTVTLSGAGAPANTQIILNMVHHDGEFPSASLGTTVSDAAGNWTATVTIPFMGIAGTGASTAMTAGDYTFGAITSDGLYSAYANYTVFDCSVPLPATGFPLAAVALAGAAGLTFAGLSLRALRRKIN